MWLETVVKMVKQNKDVQFANLGNVEEISTRKSGWGYMKIAIPNELAQRLLTKQDMNGGLLLFDSSEFSTIEKEDCSTIDAVQVVRGEWKLYGNDDDSGMSYWCTVCNFHLSEDLFYSGYKNGRCIENGVFKYCPNCGAKMEVEP